MSGRRRRLAAALAVGLLPFAAAGWGAARVCDVAAITAARHLVGAGDRIAEFTEVVEPEALPPTPEAPAIAALDGGEASLRGAPAAPAAAKPTGSEVEAEPLPSPVGVFVSRARVLAAARAGIRPGGSPVPATSWRPSGLALHGVGGLGVGLRDGDVLVAAGVPASSEGAVVGAVVGALRRRATAMSGVAWRGRQRILITVELPDLGKVDTGPDGRHAATR